MKDTPESILSRDFSEKFVEYMRNRILVSHHKYGWMSESYGRGTVDAIASLEVRLRKYRKTGNTEWLVDVANFAMIEFMFPQHKNAHFRATSSDESPGLEE